MRILTWNVNVLRTCLDYHPFTQMKKKNVEGLLEEMHAEILCFQEHKTRRAQLERSMAVPGPFDGFWTFNRAKTGSSGVCTYVDSRYCVSLKAEEGITGLLLDDKLSTMKPPWRMEERIGHYPEMDELDFMDEVDGGAFETRRLDMEGRSVVCDFGLFVLFNLYCPNETNHTRRPYKMNFLRVLQERTKLLMAAGREVIIVGDINIMRAPIDSGEGGIRTSSAQHYEHPARRILDDWCAPKGPMIDVVRESWPDREDMFTCWNQKLDARSANYGSRIDLILCSPGLRPWIKGGDIQNKVFGSDHCPVYIDLHETVDVPGRGILNLRDMLNPADRPPSTATFFPTEPPRVAPEPPRFATKFFEEFSGRQTSLKSFFGGGGRPVAKPSTRSSLVSLSPTPAPGESPVEEREVSLPPRPPSPPSAPVVDESISAPLSLARAVFASIDVAPAANGSPWNAGASSSQSQKIKGSTAIDVTKEMEDTQADDSPIAHTNGKTKTKSPKPPPIGQTKLSSFFAQPPSKAKRKSPSPTPPPPKRHTSSPISSQRSNIPSRPTRRRSTEDEDALIAQAIAEADADKASKRAATNAEAAPIWSNLFAKKLPPYCSAHHKPCRDYIVKIPGPNKGKRFWLCSLPVGAGYDTGRSKRPREDVNPNFRCDFFLWDSANSRKEVPATKEERGSALGS